MHKNRMLTFDIKRFAPHLPIYAFAFVLVIGILFGCVVVNKYEVLTQSCNDFLKEYCEIRTNEYTFAKVYSSLLLWLPTYFVMFLLGVSAIGCVTSICILGYMGFCYGCISGYLYSTFGLVGIVYSALVLVPSALLFLFGLIILSRESFRFSYLICNACIKNNKPQNLYSVFRQYCYKSCGLLLCPLVSVIFDIGISSIFLNYFSF